MRSLFTALVSSLVIVTSVTAKANISLSRTVIIDGTPYYLPEEPVASLGSPPTSDEILPLTAITTNASTITAGFINTTINSWKSVDDVFSDSFLQAVLIAHPSGSPATIDSTATSLLASSGSEALLVCNVGQISGAGNIKVVHVDLDIPSGPYVIAKDPSGNAAIYSPLKLYFDDSQSFFKSVTAQKDGSFAVVSASLDTDSSPYVGVPSRAYALSQDPTQFPLAGIRVDVKDIYFLKGIRASCGNRNFYSTYGPRNATGPAVSRLMSLGANIIGLTKTVQFANGDRATADWVDYHAAFSARGDGYHEPSGSSTGAGASVGALDWVDVGIGSDTGGSIRGPSGVNGVYGIRPSVGAISLDDVMPLSDILDTGGYITRDPKIFQTFGKNWYAGSFKSYSAFPKSILLSTGFNTVSAPAMTVYNDFFGKLADFLNGTVSNFSIPAVWNQTATGLPPVATLMNQTYATLIAVHQWTVLGAPFYSDYAAQNGGRTPHINPAVLERWQYGQSRSQTEFNQEVTNQQTFENWTTSNFLTPDAESCTKSIYLYPQEAGTYDSRELYFGTPTGVPFGFSDGRVAVFARSPDMVVPIGQIPYKSNVTGIQEMQPVALSIVGARGCDFVLMDLVGALADKGILQTVKTGRTAF